MIRPKLIIIEGPDCSGKTTLAKFLAQRFNAIYWHMTCTPQLVPGMADYMFDAIKNAEWNMMHRAQTVVFDRFWPSEFCYGHALRPKLVEKFPFEELQHLVQKLNGVYVFCNRVDVVEAHAAKMDPAHPYDKFDFQEIVQNYLQLMLTYAQDTNTVMYDYENQASDLETVAKEVEACDSQIYPGTITGRTP